MAEYKFNYPYKLPTLNEYINVERGNKYAAGKLKKNTEIRLCLIIKNQLKGVRIDKPVKMRYLWSASNKKKDKDNIAFAKKFIQDALVKSGVLKNDGWNNIDSFEDLFEVTGKDGVTVEIIEN